MRRRVRHRRCNSRNFLDVITGIHSRHPSFPRTRESRPFYPSSDPATRSVFHYCKTASVTPTRTPTLPTPNRTSGRNFFDFESVSQRLQNVSQILVGGVSVRGEHPV